MSVFSCKSQDLLCVIAPPVQPSYRCPELQNKGAIYRIKRSIRSFLYQTSDVDGGIKLKNSLNYHWYRKQRKHVDKVMKAALIRYNHENPPPSQCKQQQDLMFYYKLKGRIAQLQEDGFNPVIPELRKQWEVNFSDDDFQSIKRTCPPTEQIFLMSLRDLAKKRYLEEKIMYHTRETGVKIPIRRWVDFHSVPRPFSKQTITFDHDTALLGGVRKKKIKDERLRGLLR